MIRRISEKKDNSGIKKIMKKNQVVILALALMLMTAGYMNYTNNHENENLLLAQLGDAKLVSANVMENNTISQNETTETKEVNQVAETQNQVQETNANQVENVIAETNNTVQNETTEEIIDANNVQTTNEEQNITIETSSNNSESNDDYFTKSKLERETMYSQMLETYQKILENEKIPSDQKDIAENEIKNINDKKNAIMITENLLKTKGFEDAVIFINDPSVNVVLKQNNLDTKQIAQIQNIIQRELKTEIENIHISSQEL